MKQSIFSILLCAFCLFCASCEKPLVPAASPAGNVTFTFEPTNSDLTRGTVTAFTKLNVQLFDAQGEKVFDKVKTQTAADDDFCTMSLKLSEGTYTIVAVGHSSKNSATIKSTEAVQFTASDGEKLTDTFCHCSTIVVSGDNVSFTLPMYRVGAMIQFVLTDTQVPNNFAYFLNFNST